MVEQRRIERKAETVFQLAEDYIAAQKRPKVSGEPRKKSWSDEQRMLDKDVLPAIGHLKAKEVVRRDVIAMLNAISQRAPITSNRVHSLVRRMFNFGIRQAILEANPAVQIERNSKSRRVRNLRRIFGRKIQSSCGWKLSGRWDISPCRQRASCSAPPRSTATLR